MLKQLSQLNALILRNTAFKSDYSEVTSATLVSLPKPFNYSCSPVTTLESVTV